MKIITRNVLILSMVSLFTDIASEMLYPVMPVYLRAIGFSVILIGILEGVAEATAGLSKGYFGNLSDATGKRSPFIRIGYALSALSKPMLALFKYPLWVFFSRTTDRLGKGIRTGARDALLSDETTSKYKGRVFGFHRSMDTLGAVFGPLIALLYLAAHPGNYKALFFIAFIPGILSIGITFLIREKKKTVQSLVKKPGFLDFIKYWKVSHAVYRQLLIALLFFALLNSSDVFLLLKIKENGFGDTTVIGIYVFYNFVYAAFSYPLGKLADKIGMKSVLIAGLLFFVAVYTGMAINKSELFYFVLFFSYGIYAAATEGITKAWITNICKEKDTATAIGMYTSFQSICTLLASSITGLVWYAYGGKTALLITAGGVLLIIPYLLLLKPGYKLKAV
ncbi:MFS transporter [Mucilaginibacter sp.]|uniref:MFS transporter n=1 Tax=Mucilaginibacter sp. TaxID=1882438 RepID=UPI00283D9B13|nr:MFS transporter [Mucilaginibacter sp.]MDR3693939.1 MFS transporter [Mucilaginibacter sp.]